MAEPGKTRCETPRRARLRRYHPKENGYAFESLARMLKSKTSRLVLKCDLVVGKSSSAARKRLLATSMDLLMRFVMLVMFSSFLLLMYEIYGVEGGRKIAKEDLDEIKKELKLLNKPSIKTIKTKYGEIYDCVDFYKQPAFDHPLLKNHTFHHKMRPSSLPSIMMGEKELSTKNMKKGFKGIGCPVGTVPIRRTTKEDLIRARLHLEKYGSKYNILDLEHPGHHYAVARTKVDPAKKYVAGAAGLSLWNPPVQNTQFSSGRLKIQNGQDSIEVGWTVNPTLYGHDLTHLYTYLNAGQSQCFNMRCPGFVLVDKDSPADEVQKATKKGQRWIEVELFFIRRDPADGNWWLHYGEDLKPVGFWPQSIFTGLRDLATTVEWGGEVFSPPDIPSPPMGSGEPHIELDTGHDAMCKLLATIDEGETSLKAAIDIELFKDSSNYDIVDCGFKFEGKGHLVLFGGPGGATGN